MMIALYGLFRFMLEFIRNNTIIWIGMTFGQIYSVICIVIAICAMMKEKKQIENG
ncbi:MAG: prolipoprotein diacylglyceryl transferase [Firmicutes bacterium]|nr:prolipoprotein diacylglyceryl transferase [Bacillota bacterium]